MKSDIIIPVWNQLGYTKEELLLLSPYDITTDLSEKISGIEDNISAFGSHVFETIHLTKKGRQIPVEINSFLVELSNCTFSKEKS